MRSCTPIDTNMTTNYDGEHAMTRTRYQNQPVVHEPPVHVELAAEAVLNGWTREQVIDALIGRIKRDQGYLAYRKACNRRTSYDGQVQQDIRALALAAVLLQDEATAPLAFSFP